MITRRNTLKHAPGPRGGLIWGSLPDFKQDALGFLSKATHDHGDVVRMRFGPVTAHLVNRPEYVEQILSHEASCYDKNTRSVARIQATCGDSLLSANQDAWLRHRKLIQPVFQPRYLETVGDTVDGAMETVLNRWSKISDQGGTIDIVSEMMHLVISISAEILFASSVASDRIEDALDIILADTWRRLEAPLDPSMISKRFHRRAFKNAVSEIDDIVFNIIQNRRNSGIIKDDLLSRLLAAHEGSSEAQLTDQELRDAAVTLLLAGHETTANALSWAFYSVAKAPEMNFEASNLHHVFSETIRLYPSIWIIERRAIKDNEINGYHIPRGSSVLISPYLLHRHPEFWPNAEQFDPTRFDPERIAQRPRHAYIPFGLGPHRCVGLHMATSIATRIMQNVYKRFRLHLMPEQTATIMPSITLRHSGSLRMTLKTVL